MASTSKARDDMRDITEQLMELRTLTVAKLQERHRELFGVPTRSRNKQFLVKRLAWRIQERAEGGLSPRAEARVEELSGVAPARHNRPADGAIQERDPRLPPVGTVLSRRYKGEDYEVTVLAEGFEYDGQTYGSLSAVALEITGTVWNGLLFFGLQKRKRNGGAS